MCVGWKPQHIELRSRARHRPMQVSFLEAAPVIIDRRISYHDSDLALHSRNLCHAQFRHRPKVSIEPSIGLV